MDIQTIKMIESKIGYVFCEKSLLVTAFTHSTYTEEHDSYPSYERLEYIGDSVISLLVAKFLFDKFPNSDQGVLSKIRSIIVNEKSLAEATENLGLEKFFLCADILGNITQRLKGDLFEAIVGAIYVDSNDLLSCKVFVISNLDNKLNAEYNHENITDYKSSLFEYAAKNSLFINFKTGKQKEESDGFFSEISIDGVCFGYGEGRTKKLAEQAAAKNAIKVGCFQLQ